MRGIRFPLAGSDGFVIFLGYSGFSAEGRDSAVSLTVVSSDGIAVPDSRQVLYEVVQGMKIPWPGRDGRDEAAVSPNK